MRTFVFLGLFVFPTIAGYAQFSMLHYFSSSNDTQYTCDGIEFFPSTTTWEAYQTEDNLHDGAVLSTSCIYVSDGMQLHFLNYDAERSVFVRYVGPQVSLLTNDVCTMSVDVGQVQNFNFTAVELCGEGLCQGAILEIEVPDDPNDLDELPERRRYTLEMNYSNYGIIGTNCFATERFESNNLVELTLKFNVIEGLSNLYMDSPVLWSASSVDQLTQEYLAQSMNSSNEIDLSFWGMLITMNELPDFPSESSVDTLFVTPGANPEIQQTVDIVIGEDTALAFQPFTVIDGSPVMGNPDLHHGVNFIFQGGTFCFPYGWWDDIAMGPGEKLQLISGNIEMSRLSCFRIEVDATLHIGPDATFQYGRNGSGMIALHSNCNVVLEGEVDFTFNSLFSLWDNSWEETPSDIHIWLRPGQRWIFGPEARIMNRSTNEKMKVVFHLAGGFLDLGKLTPDDLRHVRVETMASVQGLTISRTIMLDNGEWLIELNAPESGPLTLEAFDASGKLLSRSSIEAMAGYNQMRWDSKREKPAIVVLNIRNAQGENASVKLLNH